MPKLNSPPATPRGKRMSNISLPERASPLEITPSILRRNTLTEESASSKLRKKLKIPTTPVIPEDETAEDTLQTPSFAVENETKKLKRNESNASKVSTISSKSTKVSYENKAFEGSTKPNDSRNNSVRTGSRAPSIQSLEVYREQYCCCTKRTRCEKYLVVTVTVLVIIIVVLIVVVCVLSKNNPNKVNQLFKI